MDVINYPYFIIVKNQTKVTNKNKLSDSKTGSEII